MEIHERYPSWMKLYRGGGLSRFSRPLRRLLSRMYGLHPIHRGGGTRSSSPTNGSRVVSVGNLEWGGAGKTPCVMTLCEGLSGRGLRPVVVTRGYGSRAERAGPYIIPSSGEEIGPGELGVLEEQGLGGRVVGSGGCGTMPIAELIGDEAALYRARGLPVVVDGNRERAIDIAERLFRPTHLILDDAFQRRGLPRHADILLLDSERPFGTGELMPLGSLRERPVAVRRADIVVFTRSESDRMPSEAAGLVEGKPVFFSSHRPTRLVGRSGVERPLDLLGSRSVALFSGIARPESFEASVESIGAEPVVSFRFADHHRYSPADVSWMLERLGGSGATLVTTEKDMVKSGSLFPDEVDLVALAVEMEIRGLERLLDLIAG